MGKYLAMPVLMALAILPGAAQDKKKAPPKTEPRIALVLPLGAAPGKTTKLTIRGQALDSATEVKLVNGKGSVKLVGKGKAGVPDKNPDKVGDTQVEIQLTLDAKIDGVSVSLAVVTPNGETKPHVVLIESTLVVVAEKEANDNFRTAQLVQMPLVIEGTIGRPRDVDVFRFEGKKGQKVLAEVLASRHGSPLDAILTLYDAKMEQIALSDDFTKEHRDSRIEATLPADGVYFLSLIDAHDTGSNLHVYRLVVK